MDRSYQAIDAVSLESFPWADLSIFQDEEMNAKGTSFFFIFSYRHSRLFLSCIFIYICMDIYMTRLGDGVVVAGIDLDALGTLDVDFAKACSGDVMSDAHVEKNGKKKKGGRRPRGPKPKYVFSSPEQAAAARRERNRAAALQSYYKKRNHIMNLEQQVRELEDEQNKLTMLLEHVENGTITTIHCEGDIEEHMSKL